MSNVNYQMSDVKCQVSIVKCDGFTFVEVLVIVGILSLLVGLGLSSYFIFYSKSSIDSVAKNIVNVLRLAQTKTLASERALNFGIHFENDKYVLFEGLTYYSTSTTNQVFNLSGDIEISNINLINGPDVVFEKVTGKVLNFGEITIFDKKNYLSRLIKIDNFGNISIYEQEDLPAFNTRIIDSRHVHFVLGWSIKNSTTLTLTFSDPPNPDVVKNIDMANYFNSDKTYFNWEGEYEIYGSIQKLKIHTHLLNDTNTILSISRDRRYNNKAVKISIDGKEIAQYSATSTVNVLGFGGTMEIQ